MFFFSFFREQNSASHSVTKGVIFQLGYVPASSESRSFANRLSVSRFPVFQVFAARGDGVPRWGPQTLRHFVSDPMTFRTLQTLTQIA